MEIFLARLVTGEMIAGEKKDEGLRRVVGIQVGKSPQNEVMIGIKFLFDPISLDPVPIVPNESIVYSMKAPEQFVNAYTQVVSGLVTPTDIDIKRVSGIGQGMVPR